MQWGIWIQSIIIIYASQRKKSNSIKHIQDMPVRWQENRDFVEFYCKLFPTQKQCQEVVTRQDLEDINTASLSIDSKRLLEAPIEGMEVFAMDQPKQLVQMVF